jgi:hypothetical protein
MNTLLLTKDNVDLWGIYRKKCIPVGSSLLNYQKQNDEKHSNECQRLYQKLFVQLEK